MTSESRPADHGSGPLDYTDLCALLDVASDGPGQYIGTTHHDPMRPVIEGSQMLAQTLVAASRHAPGRRVVSASMLFARVATTAEPIAIELDEIANGRTFTVLAPRIVQSGRTCAVGNVMLDVTAPDLVRHEVAAPPVPGPDESVPLELGITGREIRVVNDAFSLSSDAPVGPPQLDVWIRFRETPADQEINVGLLTHLTGYLSLAAAMRPHAGVGLDQAHRTITTGVNAISLAVHRAISAGDWMLYQHHSTFAGDGMTHSECRIHDQAGHLLASYTVESMMRAMATDGVPTGRPAM